jgi:hypothetical protein
MTPANGWRPHSVLLISATVQSVRSVDPVLSRPVTDTLMPEPSLNPDLGWQPSRPFAVNGAGDAPYLAGTFAMFNMQSHELRLMKQARVEALYAPDTVTDFTPPTVLDVKSTAMKGAMYISTTVQDSAGTVSRVLVTFFEPGRIWSADLTQDLSDASGLTWSGTIDGVMLNSDFIVQAVDNAGNMTQYSTKGGYLEAPPAIQLYLPLVFKNSVQ